MKKLLFMLMFVPLVLFGSGAAAQTSPTPGCEGLNESDCQLLQEVLSTTQAAGSFNVANFTLNFGGSGGTSAGNSLAITGSGPMQITPKGRISALKFDVTGGFNNESSSGQVMWVENMLYWTTGEASWSAFATDAEDSLAFQNLLDGSLISTALLTPDVTTVTRAPDQVQNGVNLVGFEGNIDLANLLLTPEVLAVLQTLLEGMGESGQDAFGGDIGGAIRLLANFFDRDLVQATLWAGAEDKLIRHVEFRVDLALDAPQLGESALFFEIVVDLDQHGAAFEIAPPAEFTEAMLDINSLFNSTIGIGLGMSTAAPLDLTVENTLNYGDLVRGSLSQENPQDVWGFSAQAGDVITITAQALDITTGLDTVIRLYDAAGTELAMNDDHGTDNRDLDVFDSQLQFTIPAAGEYRILVTWQAELRDAAEYQLSVVKP